MNHSELRLLMLHNKSFLKALFESKSVKAEKSVLIKSTIDEINVLLHVLFSITQGEIPIKKRDFQILKKSKRISILHNTFENKLKFDNIMSLNLKEKMKLLYKFTSIYSTLLCPLFQS